MFTEKLIYKDATRTIAERVQDLLAIMTVDEKIAQLGGVWVTDLINAERQFDLQKATPKLQHGIGHLTRVGAMSLLEPQATAQLANTLQKHLRENTRLGIPAIVHEESCAGYLARGATTFPQAIGMAATWNPELIQEMATVIRGQMRTVGAHHTLAPVLDVTRDPRWGRTEETFGEDPFLVSAIGVAYVKGIQGENLRQGIVATGKHFIGYGWSEGGLNWAPAHIPERELREIFVTPFAAAIREAKIASMMNAYHEIDGVPCGASRQLMVDLLRDELGFEGVVVSDYFTLDMFVQYHRLTQRKQEAARLGLEAGIDVELPAHDVYGEPLRQALESGEIDIALVDTSVGRLLQMKFALGLFENPYVDTDQVIEVYQQDEDRHLSRRIAHESIILLKNENNLLPLNSQLKTIAIIGPAADSIRLLQGDYHYPSHFENVEISMEGNEAPMPGNEYTHFDFSQHFPPSTTVLQGIQNHVSQATVIHYALGCDVIGEDTSGIQAAVDAAKKAEVAIVVVGDKSGLGIGCTSGEAVDRADLALTGVQQQLVEAVYHTGTPTIVILMNGRPPAIPWIAEYIPAILETWLPAEEGGNAIADVLFGKVNPAGRLPMSLPRSSAQLPVYYNHKPSGARSHWLGSYIDMSTTPLFPFGHGLSYTQFKYDNLKVSASEVQATDVIQIHLDIQNIGPFDGDEVVQLYVNDEFASVTRPVKALKGFKRVHLKSGETKKVCFNFDIRHLAFYDLDMNYVVEPGTIKIMLGSSSEDIRATAHLTIVGNKTMVEPVFLTSVVC